MGNKLDNDRKQGGNLSFLIIYTRDNGGFEQMLVIAIEMLKSGQILDNQCKTKRICFQDRCAV